MYAWTVPWNLPFRCLDVCQILSSWACSHRSSIKAFTSEACNMALKQRWRKKEIKIQLKHKYKCNWNTNTKAIETQIHWNRGAERKRRKESDVCTMRKTLTMLHVLEISRWPCEDSGSPLIGNSAFLSWTWDIVTTMQRRRPGPWWIASRFGGG